VFTLSNLTSVSLDCGNNEEIVDRGIVVVKESLQVLGPYHSNTLIAKSTLAIACYRVGRLNQAVDLNLEVLCKTGSPIFRDCFLFQQSRKL
jgi:hypothetical protein